MQAPQPTYYQQRCQAIGITPENNFFTVPEYAAFAGGRQFKAPILLEDKSGGILIPVYHLSGDEAVYDKNAGATTKSNNPKATAIKILRHHPDNYARMVAEAERLKQPPPGKYQMPKGAKAYPWISPSIIDAYRNKTPLNTIVLTEGYFKAIAGWLNGLHMFGLSSISTYKDKDAGTLHPDILAVIETCQVQNVILLYDGDCNNISLNALTEGKDLYRRPAGFYNSAAKINELLKDYQQKRHFGVYFAHVNTQEIDGNPKGLDDLLETLNAKERTEAVKELTSVSKQRPYYFTRINITNGLYQLKTHLHIDGPEEFYKYHGTLIKDKPFIYHGTKFKWDDERKELQIIIPAAAKLYMRVGNHYYKKIHVPNELGKLEYRIQRRDKSTIELDHGRKFLDYIPKYEDFCVKPDHANYQEVIDSCYNSYRPFEHAASTDASCPKTLEFIHHIFGDKFEIGLDYIQLLYQRPTEKLPILCLVSKDQETGKSTFLFFLKAIFTGNMAIVGNDQLENKFNAGWADKLIVGCEESLIEKKRTVEKLKALSTGTRIEMERKGVDTSESSFFAKFILCSNNETNFTLANETDKRYFVIRVPRAKHSNPHLLDELCDEIPNFLCFLNRRQLHTPKKESRMWFDFERIKTDAFARLVDANKSGAEKEIRAALKSIFCDCGWWRVDVTLKYIHEVWLNKRYSKDYVEQILHDKFKKRTANASRVFLPEIKMTYSQQEAANVEQIMVTKLHGRPYTFYANEFLTAEEQTQWRISEAAYNNGQLDYVPAPLKQTCLQDLINIPAPQMAPQLTNDVPY